MAENNAPERIQPGKSKDLIGTPQKAPNQAAFERHMEAPSKTSMEGTPNLQNPPLSPNKPTIASIQGQANSMGASLDSLKSQLEATPNLKMRRQESQKMESHLKKANTHLQKASSKLGTSYSNTQNKKPKGPIERFLGYVTDGQRQILAAKKRLETLKTEGSLNPADLISVQVELSQAQQSLEYSSLLLANATSMFKQIMNIQI